MKTLKELYALWEKLGDVPVREHRKTHSNLLDAQFLDFKPGTPVEAVWHWFEAQNPHFIVGEVQSGRFRDLDDPTKMASTERPMSLFDVTLDWCPGDIEQGDYGTLVWASSRREAVRLAAEEMADSGEVTLPDPDADPLGYAKERSKVINDIISGAGQYAAIDIGRRILGDVESLVRGPDSINLKDPINAQAKTDFDQIKAILSKYGVWIHEEERQGKSRVKTPDFPPFTLVIESTSTSDFDAGPPYVEVNITPALLNRLGMLCEMAAKIGVNRMPTSEGIAGNAWGSYGDTCRMEETEITAFPGNSAESGSFVVSGRSHNTSALCESRFINLDSLTGLAQGQPTPDGFHREAGVLFYSKDDPKDLAELWHADQPTWQDDDQDPSGGGQPEGHPSM